MRKGGYPDRWADIQSAQLYSGNNFCQALVFLKCHFPHQDAPLSSKSGVGVYLAVGHPDHMSTLSLGTLG